MATIYGMIFLEKIQSLSLSFEISVFLLPFLPSKRFLCFQIAKKVVQYRVAYYYLNQLIWRERIHFEINRLY